MNRFMLSKNKSVSLCKGQNQGEFSPSSNVLKDIMSPCGVQNGVSPDYVSKASVNQATDTKSTIKASTASSTENVEEAVWFSCLCKKMFLLMIPFEVKYYVEMCNIIFSKKSSV